MNRLSSQQCLGKAIILLQSKLHSETKKSNSFAMVKAIKGQGQISGHPKACSQ